MAERRNVEHSISVDLDELTASIREAASGAAGGSEEDLRFGVEKVLRDSVLDPLGIPPARYEVATRKYGTLITGARLDALLGHVVIEYEPPHSLKTKNNFDHAVQQVKEGILRHSGGSDTELPRYFGVVIDGFSVGFVRYRRRLHDFDVSKQPLDVTRITLARLVEAIIGLRRKALDATELLKDFGPGSQISQKVLGVFYDKLKSSKALRTSILFDDWKRVFSQVCAYDPEKLKRLQEQYGFAKTKADMETLLFALHSYFALLMKLIGAEVASLYWRIMGSYLKILEEAHYKGSDYLKEQLTELEDGGIFAKLGISNFLEGDYFAWYLDEWDVQLADSLALVVTKLSDYDPSTADLEPDKLKDLFKHLYQHLVPRKIRHDLGEFYTPDWLAELVLDESGFDLNALEKIATRANDQLAPLDIRILDPACGSGTFLIMAIKRVREYVDEHWIDKESALRKLTRNVIGFDLNPLAVMASRTNYLISIGDLLREKGNEDVEIPVYLADSILVDRRTTVLGTSAYSLRTVAGEFRIPITVVDNGFLGKLLGLTEESLRLKYPEKDFLGMLRRELTLTDDEIMVMKELFAVLSKLEREKKNRIWLRVLKNSFAPLLLGKFDFVVGNPPWVNWEHLPDSYRELTKSLWDKYGLRRHTRGAGLGKVNRDISMLFVTVCVDRYLRDDGSLGLLIPFTIFKNQTGAGFRMFLSYKCATRRVHDLVTLAPFEGALNRTSLVVLGKGASTFPLDCVSWTRGREAIQFDAELEDVKKLSERHSMIMEPVEGTNLPDSSWFMVTPGAATGVRKVLGTSPYKASVGVYTGANGIYWAALVSGGTKDTPLIRNLSRIGKKDVHEMIGPIDLATLYPLVRGRDVGKWRVETQNTYVIVPHDFRTGKPFQESVMRQKYSKTYAFLSQFRKELEERAIQKLWGKDKPFYTLYDISDESFAHYKIAWKEIAGKISGKGDFSVAVIGPVVVSGQERIPICDHKLMTIPFKNEDEAHFVASILNSSIARLIVASYTIETAIDTHIMSHIRIPEFDPTNQLHMELAALSKRAHEAAQKGDSRALSDIEDKIDQIVSAIHGITSAELLETKESLSILMGEEAAARFPEPGPAS